MTSARSASVPRFVSPTNPASNSSSPSAHPTSSPSDAAEADHLTFHVRPQQEIEPLLLGIFGDRASSIEYEARQHAARTASRRSCLVAAVQAGCNRATRICRKMSREDLLLAEADAIQKRYDRASCQLRQARESLDANSCAALALDERLKLQDALVERGLCASRMAHLRLMCSVAGMPEDKTPFLRIDLVHRTELEVQGLLR